MSSEDEWDEMEWDWLDKDVNPDLDDDENPATDFGGSRSSNSSIGACLVIFFIGVVIFLCWFSFMMGS